MLRAWRSELRPLLDPAERQRLDRIDSRETAGADGGGLARTLASIVDWKVVPAARAAALHEPPAPTAPTGLWGEVGGDLQWSPLVADATPRGFARAAADAAAEADQFASDGSITSPGPLYWDPPIDQWPTLSVQAAARAVRCALSAGAPRRVIVDAAISALEEMAKEAKRPPSTRQNPLANMPVL